MTDERKAWGRVFSRGGRFWIAYCGPRQGRAVEMRESVSRVLGRPATERDAWDLLRRREREVANHREGLRPFAGVRGERLTVGMLMDELLEDYRLRKLASLQPTTVHVRRVVEVLGGYRAGSVTPSVIARYVRIRRQDGVSDTTIDRELELLGHAFRRAARAVPTPRVAFVPHIPKLVGKHQNARQGFFSREEFERVLAGIPDDGFRDYLEWFWFTGWRVRESGTLRWEYLDRETWTIRLPAKNAKTRRPRSVPVVGPLRPVLERRLEARRLDVPYVFSTDAGLSIHDEARRGLRRSLYRLWSAACAAAELSDRIPYDLRRCAVRNLIRSGVSRKVAMQITGHLTEETFNRYDITEEQDTRRALEGLAPVIDLRTKVRTGGPA